MNDIFNEMTAAELLGSLRDLVGCLDSDVSTAWFIDGYLKELESRAAAGRCLDVIQTIEDNNHQ